MVEEGDGDSAGMGGVDEGVVVEVGVGEVVPLGVPLGVPLREAPLDGVPEGVEESEGVMEGVSVPEGDWVGETVGVGDDVRVEVGVGREVKDVAEEEEGEEVEVKGVYKALLKGVALPPPNPPGEAVPLSVEVGEGEGGRVSRALGERVGREVGELDAGLDGEGSGVGEGGEVAEGVEEWQEERVGEMVGEGEEVGRLMVGVGGELGDTERDTVALVEGDEEVGQLLLFTGVITNLPTVCVNTAPPVPPVKP